MNTRFLETLVWLSRLGSFSETALHLHTTQAAVSQRIATLEAELGCTLVDRRLRAVRLTAAGERVLQQAERLLALEAQLRSTARPDAPPTGRVRVGVIESVVHTWLAPLVHSLARSFPDVKLDFNVDTARNLRQQFRQRQLDILIQNDAVEEAAGNDELTCTDLCRLPVRWIGLPGLLPRRRLTLDDLLAVPLLTFSRTSSPHAHLRALFIGSEREPRISSFPSVAAILRLLCEGFGLAAIPPVFVQPQIQSGALIEYRGPALPSMTLSIVHFRVTSAAVQVVATTVLEVVAAYCQETREPWTESLLAKASSADASIPGRRRLP